MTTDTDTMRVVLYARQSRTRTDESASCGDQLAELRDRAAREGWHVVGEYADRDAPATRWDRRTRWAALIADAEAAGDWDAVAVVDTARLYRPDLAERLVVARSLDDAGIGYVLTPGSRQPVNGDDDPEGALIRDMLAAIAAFDNALRAHKVRGAMARERREGRPHAGGHRPFGWCDRDRSRVNDAEADAIRDAVARLIGGDTQAGESLSSVATEWNRAGITTTTGRPWTRNSFRRMLLSPTLAGYRVLSDDETIPGTWTGVITDDQHRKLHATMTARRGSRRPHRNGVTLLSGLLRCGRCHAPMNANRNGRGRPVYVCGKHPNTPERCGRMSIARDDTDALVTDAILGRLADDATIARHAAAAEQSNADLAAARRTLREAEDRRVDIGRMVADGLLDGAAARAALDRIGEQVNAARAAVDAADAPTGLLTAAAADPAGWWTAASTADRRVIVAALVERIDIAPSAGGRYYRPERVSMPVWK